jgi:hypothetical protein
VVSGVVCITAILIVGLAIVGSVLFFRDALRDFEQADRAMEAVEQQYGPIEGFHPQANGAILPERVEAFLAVRELSSSASARIERSLTVLSKNAHTDESEGPGPIRKLAAGVGLLHRLAGFLNQRNEVLLEMDMGLGEYYYIYSLAYYSLLDRSPGDGPSFELVGENGYVLEDLATLDDPHAREHREEAARRGLNRLLLPVLRNQLSELNGEEEDGNLDAWRELLSAEIAALETDARRLPWQDGLPETITSSLNPYRDRLESSYLPMCNALEVGVARR